MSRQTLIPSDDGCNIGLESFYDVGNETLLAELRRLIAGVREKAVIYIWGESGSGKTHLLDACCIAANTMETPGLYFSLSHQSARLNSFPSDISNAVVCIDDIDGIADDEKLQTKLLSIYEVVAQNSGSLVVSALSPPNRLGLRLKDLESRLVYGGVYHVKPLSDLEKKEALKLRAAARGFALDDKVAAFIMSRCSRDTRSLFAMLDNLDSASLRARRRITIPFLKTLL